MQKNIFNVYVAMDSQETCDRMKAVCLENGLPIWEDYILIDLPFEYNEKYGYSFRFNGTKYFAVYENDVDFTQVTEPEFLELLKEYKLNK